MTQDPDNDRPYGTYASPPCMAAEIAPDYFDPLAVDREQARDVARWRKAERIRLLAGRKALRADERHRNARALMSGLQSLLVRLSGTGRAISFYWPIRDEPDLRPLMTALYESGGRIALPVVERKAAPLVFREWTPRTRLERGHWNIPVPPAGSPLVRPDILLAPLVGWDGEGYRLGYGGGYFDRTLAALSPGPVCIGIGLAQARVATIFPQPHDIPFDLILTEQGIAFDRTHAEAQDGGGGPGI